MDITKIIFELAGGLALFLYGIFLMSEGFQKIAGERLQKILEKFTNKPVKGIASGAAVTAIIQSSSITTVILLGFVNAGLINLSSAAGVIMGANIGTTITAQIISLNFKSLALPIIAIGFLLWFFNRGKKQGYWGQAILGLGLLFLGMLSMSSGVAPLKENPAVFEWFLNFGKIPILGILAGAVFTGIVQSSSASIGLVLALASQGLLNLESAVPIVLGAEVGTTVTVLLASIGSSKNAKRMALLHTLFNVLGVALAFFALKYFILLAGMTSDLLPRQIANAHTIFNLSAAFILVWIIPLLVKIVKRIIPGKEIKLDHWTKYLDRRLLSTPSIALAGAFKETMGMADVTRSMMNNSIKAFMNGSREDLELIRKQERGVDYFYKAINEYCQELSVRNLSHEETQKMSMIIHNTTDIERVADHVNNIGHITKHKREGDVKFNDVDIKELEEMFEKSIGIFEDAINSWKEQNHKLAEKVMREEGEIDILEKKFRNAHIERLKRGESDPASGVAFESMLENLERIGDHADNIAYSVVHGF